MTFYLVGRQLSVIKACLAGVRITATTMLWTRLLLLGISIIFSMESYISVYQITSFVILSGKTYIDYH